MILDLYLVLLLSDEVVERSDASLHTASHLHGRVGGGCRREGGGGQHPLRRSLALPQHPVRCPWEPALTSPHLFHLLLLLLLLLQHQQHLMLLVLTLLLLVNQKAAAADSLSGQQLQQPWWGQVVLTLKQPQLSAAAGKRASRRASLRFWRQFRSTPPCDTIARNTPAIHRGPPATDLMLAFKNQLLAGKKLEKLKERRCRPLFVCSVCGFAKGQEPESTFNKFHLLERAAKYPFDFVALEHGRRP